MNSVEEKIPNKSRKTELKNLEAIFNHCIKCETDCDFKKVSQYALKIGLEQFLMQKEKYCLPMDISCSLVFMRKALVCSVINSEN